MMRCLVLLLTLALGLLGAAESEPILVPPITTPAGETTDDIIMPPGTARRSDAGVVDVSGEDPTIGEVPDAPGFELRIGTGGERQGYSTVIKILLLMTVLSVAPGFLMLMTSFARIIIVLGFVRRALGTQTLPPNQVLLGISLFMTLFVMAPTFQAMNDEALQPFLNEQIDESEALDRAADSMRRFMARHTRKSDLALFIRLAGEERPTSIDEVSFLTLIPAFATSELKTAFQMGFVIFLPFVVIDLVIAAILMALGMMMLPPVMISLPFKVLLFVLVDGWVLLLQSLAASYGGGG